MLQHPRRLIETATSDRVKLPAPRMDTRTECPPEKITSLSLLLLTCLPLPGWSVWYEVRDYTDALGSRSVHMWLQTYVWLQQGNPARSMTAITILPSPPPSMVQVVYQKQSLPQMKATRYLMRSNRFPERFAASAQIQT